MDESWAEGLPLDKGREALMEGDAGCGVDDETGKTVRTSREDGNYSVLTDRPPEPHGLVGFSTN
jgi:hypothetical protein